MAKLMLVEDDNNLREIYEARLQAEGYVIVSAKDGEEALVVAKAEKPELIISDVMMPKISGFEMLDILRNTDELKHVKVIMLTALGQSDDQQRADRLGADRYLVKSQVTLEDIVKVTHELLGDQEGDDGSATSTPAPATPALAASPAPAPVPEPVAEPPATPAAPATPAVSGDGAISAAQEEANVEAQIEDFVAGASSEPTAPTGPPTAPAADDTPATPAAADTDNDEETFVAGADATASPAAPAITPATTSNADDVVAIVAPTSAPETPPVVEGEGVTAAPAPNPDQGSVPIANKKVIKPLDTTDKKDIHTLLALEEVAEKSQQGPPPPTAIIATDTEGPQTVPLGAAPAADAATPKISLATSGNAGNKPSTDAPEDPNSIAL